MLTPKTKLYSSFDIIRIRDTMSLNKLRAITNRVKKKQSYVDFSSIFKEMGFIYAYNNKWYKM